MSYKVYNDVSVSSEVLSASKHRLVQMLIDKCMSQMEAAKMCIINKNMTAKHKTIASALDIIAHLHGSLNLKDEAAKELSNQLAGIYVFMERNLLKANLKNDSGYIEQAQAVLANIKEGWDKIG